MTMRPFAEACYNENTISDLRLALVNHVVDYTDMKEWDLTEDEYFSQIQEALNALLSDKECL